ncbi:MAG TPA: NUDIX hydrolase [Bacteroidota bacterium]|nr:NUDIX hydrolase [Bacteroidota bacterium]
MLQHWKRLTTSILFRNPWWTYKKDTFRIPDGVDGEYHYVDTNGSSMIIPMTREGNIILVNQYRYLCERESIELPCGGIKEGKSPEEMAKIELEEETGFTCKLMTYIGSFNPFNGVTTEMCSVYAAHDLTPVDTQCDVTEEFEVLELSVAEIDRMISSNEIWDGMTLAALALGRSYIDSHNAIGPIE